MEIDTSELEAAFQGVSREQAMEAANRAFSSSQEILQSEGDSRGYEAFPVVQSGFPPEWDDTKGVARFGYTHPASYYWEVGTQTHPVVANDGVLAFEWPEAPPEVQQMWEHSFPTVFMPASEVDGIDRMDYVKGGIEDARDWWEGQ